MSWPLGQYQLCNVNCFASHILPLTSPFIWSLIPNITSELCRQWKSNWTHAVKRVTGASHLIGVILHINRPRLHFHNLVHIIFLWEPLKNSSWNFLWSHIAYMLCGCLTFRKLYGSHTAVLWIERAFCSWCCYWLSQ